MEMDNPFDSPLKQKAAQKQQSVALAVYHKTPMANLRLGVDSAYAQAVASVNRLNNFRNYMAEQDKYNAQQAKYAVTDAEFNQRGFVNKTLAYGEHYASKLWGSTESLAAKAFAQPNRMVANDIDNFPQEVKDARNRYQNFRTGVYQTHKPRIDALEAKQAANGLNESEQRTLAELKKQYLAAAPRKGDMELLSKPAADTIEHQVTMAGQVDALSRLGMSYMDVYERSEKNRQEYLRKTGEGKKGDMFQSGENVNPYLTNKRKAAQDRIKGEYASAYNDAVEIQQKSPLLGALAQGAVAAGYGLEAGWETLKHPGALAEDFVGSVPYMLGKTAGMAITSGLDASDIYMKNQDKFLERTGQAVVGNSADDARMQAWGAGHFAMNFTEAMLLKQLATGGRIGKEIAPAATTLGGMARGGKQIAKDISNAAAMEGAVSFGQSKIERELGSLAGYSAATNFDAMDDALSGAGVAGGLATIGSTFEEGKKALGFAAEEGQKAIERAKAQRNASFEQNLDFNSDTYNPAEAIIKQVSNYSRPDATDEVKAQAKEEAQKVWNASHQNMREATRTQDLMQQRLQEMLENEKEIADLRQQIQEDPELAPEIEPLIESLQANADNIRVRYNENVQKQINDNFMKAQEGTTRASAAMKAFEGYTGVKEGTINQKSENTQANAQALNNPEAAPEVKEAARKHMTDYPMMYTADELNESANNSSNGLTELQRTVLRELSGLKRAQNLEKGIQDVTSDIRQGGMGYRSIGSYFTEYQEAVRRNSTDRQAQLQDQFDRFAASMEAKNDLVQQAYQDAIASGDTIQVIRTLSGQWAINTGKPLTRKQMRANGGVNIHRGTTKLVDAIKKDSEAVTQAHQVFQKMTAPEFRQAAPVAVQQTQDLFSAPAAEAQAAATPELGMAEPAVITDANVDNIDGFADAAYQQARDIRQQQFEELTGQGNPDASIPDTESPTDRQPESDTPTDQPESDQVSEPQDAPETPVNPIEPVEDTENTGHQDSGPEVSNDPGNARDMTQPAEEVAATGEGMIGKLKGVTPEQRKAERGKRYEDQDLLIAAFTQKMAEGFNNPLIEESGFLSKLFDGSPVEKVQKYLRAKLNPSQENQLVHFSSWARDFNQSIMEVFLPKQGDAAQYRYRDLAQFLADENGVIDENVLTAISLSAYQWLAENGNKISHTDEELAKLLGVTKDSSAEISPHIRKRLGTVGTSHRTVIQSLGQRAYQALGLKVLDHMDSNYQGRMEGALGALALHTLVYRNYVAETAIPSSEFNALRDEALQVQNEAEVEELYDSGVEGETAVATEPEPVEPTGTDFDTNIFIRPNHELPKGSKGFVRWNPTISDITELSPNTKGMLSKLFGVDDYKRYPDLTAPESFDQQSIKNSKMDIPEETAKNIEKAQKEPFRVRAHFASLLQTLMDTDQGALKRLLKINDSEMALANLHVTQRENKKAAYENYWNSLKQDLDFISGLERDADGKYQPLFYRQRVWVNQRIGYEANVLNFQTSQVSRALVGMEAFEATFERGMPIFNAEGNNTDYGNFLRAVAAGAEDVTKKLDFPVEYKGGKTVDKAKSKYFLPSFQQYLNQPHVRARIQATGRVMKSLDSGSPINPADLKAMEDQVAEMGMGVQSMIALVELARYMETPTGQPFTTSLGIDSDGTVNGPATANTASGTLEEGMHEQFGLITKKLHDTTVLPDGRNAEDYLDVKTMGAKDYYEKLGDMQRNVLNLMLRGSNKAFSPVVHALNQIVPGGFGSRSGAKSIATPFNYSAGFPALKAAMARDSIEHMYSELAKIGELAKSEDPNDKQRAAVLREQWLGDGHEVKGYINEMIEFHNEHMQVQPKVEKLADLKEALQRIHTDYQLLHPNQELMPVPDNMQDLKALTAYMNQLKNSPYKRKIVDHPTIFMTANSLIKRHNNVLPRSKKIVSEHRTYSNPEGLADFQLKPDQLDAIRKVSRLFHGTASEIAIRELAAPYIRERDVNVQLHRSAFELYKVMKDALEQSLREKKIKEGTIARRVVKSRTGNKLVPMEDLSKSDRAYIQRMLAQYFPAIVSAMGSKSDNAVESGLFLAKSQRGFQGDSTTYVNSTVKNTHAGKNKKSSTYNTGVSSSQESAPGVLGNALWVQAMDSFVSNYVLGFMPAINVHDANISSIQRIHEMARTQNQAFFEMMLNYHAQVESYNALVRPIQGLVALSGKLSFTREQKELAKEALLGVHAALEKSGTVSREALSTMSLAEVMATLSDLKHDAELRKLHSLKELYSVHQYGAEGGHLVMTEQHGKQIDQAIEKMQQAKAQSRKDALALMQSLKTITIKDRPISNIESVEVLSRISGTAKDVDAQLAAIDDRSDFQKELDQYQGKEVPRDVMLKLMDQAIGTENAAYRALFDTVSKIIPESLTFRYENNDWVGPKGASGWFNRGSNTISIRTLSSDYAKVEPELVLHEMIHAALVRVTENPADYPEAAEAIQRLQDLYETVKPQLQSQFPNALVSKEEFMAWGLTNPAFQDRLKDILVPKAGRTRTGLVSAFKQFVTNVVTALLGKSKGNAKFITATEALILDSAEILQFMTQRGPVETDTKDGIYQMAQQKTDALDQLMQASAVEVFNALNRGNTSGAFNSHLNDVMGRSIDKLFGAIGREHLDTELPLDSGNLSTSFTDFGLSERELFAARVIEATVEGIQDSAAHTAVMRQLVKTYNQARATLKPEDFHEGDWNTATPADKQLAQRQYDALFAPVRTGQRSNYISRFVALAVASEKVSSKLGFTDAAPDRTKNNLFSRMVQIAGEVMDWATNRLAGTRNYQTANVKAKVLLDRLIAIDIKQRQNNPGLFSKAWNLVDGVFETANDMSSGVLSKLNTRFKLDQSKYKGVRILGKLAKTSGRDGLDQLPKMMQDFRNQANPNTRFGEVAELMNEVTTPGEFRMVMEEMLREGVQVQNERKGWIDNVKRIVLSNFENMGKGLRKEDHIALTYGLLRTDVQSLLDQYSYKEVVRFVKSDKARQERIEGLEGRIETMDKQYSNAIINRAKALAWYMVSGEADVGLVKNVQGIVANFGTTSLREIPSKDNALVKAVDQLVTFYALEYSDPVHLKNVAKLMNAEAARGPKESDGVEALLRVHQFARKDSESLFEKNATSMSKGYVPEITHTYRETMAASVKDEETLLKNGWEKVADLKKDPADTEGGERALYRLADNGKQRITSGVVTFDDTHRKGTTVTTGPAGAKTMRYLQETRKTLDTRLKVPHKQYDPRKSAGNYMVPSYDIDGHVTDFSYEMNHKNRDELLDRNNNIADLMGSYVGNNIGQPASNKHNLKAMHALYEDYAENFAKDPRAYVALGPDVTDKHLRETWRMLPRELRQEAESLWGKGQPIMVRADVLNMTFGFKKYSVKEMFDKLSNERNYAEQLFVRVWTSIFKDKASLRAVQTERAVQETMQFVKDVVVVRTGVVLLGNIKANAFLLLAYGVNPGELISDTVLAVRAGLSYRKQKALIIQAEANLRAGIGNPEKWNQQIVQAEDTIARNPLREFIEAGMMPSIVEDVSLGKSDYAYESGFKSYLQGKAQKVPKSLREVTKWATISPGTPLYSFLSGATQYSDFAAKYVLYKHMQKRKKNPLQPKQALQAASDAFINYDIPTTRMMQYLNDVGLVMFTKFFLRFQRVLVSLMREHPARTMAQALAISLMGIGPDVMDPLFIYRLGNPLHESVFQLPGAIADIATLAAIF